MTFEKEADKIQIIDCEKRLLEAFTKKDLGTLDEMINENALFVLPNGKNVTKQMVVENYRGGDVAMSTAISSDQITNITNEVAVVSLNLELIGTYFNQEIKSKFRYLRTWIKIESKWEVIATCGVPIAT